MTRAVCLFLILYIVQAKGQGDRKSSLTFVIDVTTSMKTVIAEVERQVVDILDALTNSNESYIDHFVLVTFADPEIHATSVTNVTETRDKYDFIDSIDYTISLLHGGDCPEYSMSGLQTGIEHSAPGSTIYVFTDASAKDYKSYEYVKYIAMKKQIQVPINIVPVALLRHDKIREEILRAYYKHAGCTYDIAPHEKRITNHASAFLGSFQKIIFIITKGCNPKLYPKGYKVYHQLAEDTSGQVFNVTKHKVHDILKFVRDSAVARRIVLAIKIFETGESNTFYYTTDHATKDTTISVTCTEPIVNVTGSDSDKLDIVHLVNLEHVAVLKVYEPKPGTYAVTMDCKSKSRTMVTAKSSIHFQHGFSTFLPTSLNDTTSEPVPGNLSYLAIKIDGEFEPQTVKLLDVHDNIISNSTMTLKVLDIVQKFYTTEPFDTKAPVFRIVLTGVDLNYNTTITRVGSLLQQQNVFNGDVKDEAPLVSIDGYPVIIADYGYSVRLKCSVHAYPQPQITWDKNGTYVETNVYINELPYDFVSLYKVEKVKQNETYTCKATNSMGNNTQTVIIAVKPILYFNVVAKPTDITIQYNKTDQSKCIVDSYPPTDIIWLKNGKALIKENGVIISDDGFEMTIKHMQPAYEGNYECKVSNGIKNITFPFKVNISGVVSPKIEKSLMTIITIPENSNTNISCRIEKGAPRPTIQWFHKNKTSGIFDEIIKARNQEHYVLPSINRKDKGMYKCYIENIVGSDTMEVSVVVEYEPTLYDTDVKLVTKKVGQEVILTCKADGVPDPTINWTKDGKHLSGSKFVSSSDHRLIFGADLYDIGTYKCTASNYLGSVSKSIYVEVENPPEVVIKASDPVNVSYNESITLKCEVFGYPRPDIKWKDISIEAEIDAELNEKKSPFHFISYLKIKNVTTNDTYRCTANNTLGDDDKEIAVITFRKPYYKVINFPEDITYSIGYEKTHIFSCKIDAYPPVVVKWYKNEKILAKDDLSVSSDGSELSINDMQPVDAGYFKCEAEHLDTTYTYPFKIQIAGVEKPKISDYRNKAHISENSDAEIICRIEKGIPKPNIQWLYKDTISSPYIEITDNKNKEYLLLKNINRKDTGTYKCIATNAMGNDTMETELVVEYAPNIDNDFIPVTVKADEMLVLKCLAYGIPEPSVFWTKDDKPVTGLNFLNSSNLNFAAKLSDAGDYTCIATNMLGSSRKNLTLKVEMTPNVMINESNPVNAEFDEPLTLRCEVFGYPKPYIIWKDTIRKTKLESDIKENTPYHYTSYLKIKKATTLMYECEASNVLGNNNTFVNVIAVKKPYFKPLRTPTDKNILYNSTELLHCEIDAYPPAVITWYKDSKLLTKRDNVKVSADGSTLTFNHMQPSQQGTYMCEASNSIVKRRFTAVVNISGLVPPEIFKKMSEKISSTRLYRFKEGSSAHLTCKIHNGVPKPTLKWFYEDKITKRSTEIVEANNQEYLFIDKVNRDSGNYKCEVNQYDDQNDYMGSDSLKMELEVGYQPTIKPDERTYTVKIGKEINVPCSVKGKPAPKVIWMRQRDNTTVAGTPDHTFRLKTTMEDNGTYICKATNEYGSSTRSVDIYVYKLDIINRRGKKSKQVDEGDSLILKCDVRGTPKPQVAWYYNGTVTDPEIPGKLVGNGRVYKIESILYEQHGRYTCVALNHGCETLTFHVDVHTPVKIHNINSNIRAVVGDLALTIHCNATGNPKPTFMWMLGGIPDSEQSDTKVFKGKNITSSSVLCYAKGKDKHDFDTFNFQITVDDYPSLNNLNYTQEEITGTKVRVHCPIPHKKGDLLRWYRDNAKIRDTELTFAKVSSSDAGLYTCRVSNYTSSESANVKLTVTSRLEFVNLVETTLSLKFEEKASLDCLVNGDPLPKVSWSYNGKVISTEPIYKLIMKHEKEGSYKCEASDGMDTISRTFNVTSDECILKIDPDGKQPLILTQYLEWPTYNYSGGFLYMPRHQSIVLACPSTGHLMSFADDVDYLYAYCNNSKLYIMKTPYTYSDLSCSEEVRPHVKWIRKACLGADSEIIKIFFKFRDITIELYEVCMDNGASSFHVPIFTKHILKSPLADSVPKHVIWFDERRPNVDCDGLYDADQQVKVISSTLGYWWHKTDHCVFSKRQLVNSLDVFPGVPQKAVFTHLNVVPHWSTCNNENWDEVESRVRNLAKTKELTVWTGTTEYLNLPHKDGTSQAILLTNSDGDSMVVSTYMWKVVQDRSKDASLAIVQLNIPDVSDAYLYVKCKDICNQTLWMSGSNWHDAAKGYTVCCELDEFEASFGYRGVFGADMNNILYH